MELTLARLGDGDLSCTAAELVGLLWEFTIEAWDSGIIEAAVHVLDLPDGRYTAVVHVYNAEVTGPAGEERGGAAPQARALARQLREPHPGDVTSRDVRVVDLPGGPAVRVAYRNDEVGALPPADATMVLEVLQHWFPDAGQPAALVVEGRKATLTEADRLAFEVDRIAASVCRYPPG